MPGFWVGILSGAWSIFETYFRRISFWATVGLTTLALAGGTYRQGQADALKKSWWILLVPAALAFLVAIKTAIENGYKDVDTKASRLGDQVVDLRQEVRRLRRLDAAELVAASARRAETVQRLTELQTQGIDLRAEIARTYVPERHDPVKRNWQDTIIAYVREREPDRVNEMRLPIPPNPQRHVTHVANILRELDTWLDRLQTLITTSLR